MRTEQEEAAMNELFDRIQMMETEIGRIKQALLAIQQGVPFTEALNDELYLEAKQDEKKSYAALYRMMEHLLKVSYYINDKNYNHWRGEINTFRVNILVLTLWETRKPDTNLIKYLDENIQDAYDDAIDVYRKDAKRYPNLRDGLGFIPEVCPWSLKELMEDEINDLITTLRNFDKSDGKAEVN